MTNRGVPGPEGPNADVARRVDPNANPLFKRPLLVVLVLAGVGGMLDADDYLTYGVFTANQAGNMVLLWLNILEEPGVALLSLSSIVGCALGIASVVFIRSRSWWPIGDRGSRLLLFTAAIVPWLSTSPITIRGPFRTPTVERIVPVFTNVPFATLRVVL